MKNKAWFLWAPCFVLAALWQFDAARSATAYYVSPGGSDSNPGSQGAPLLTIQRAVDLAVAGDVVLVGPGTYSRNCGNPAQDMLVYINKAGVTLRSIVVGGAILDGLQKCHSLFGLGSQSANVVIEGFTLRNSAWGGVLCNSGGCKGVTVSNNDVGFIGNRYEGSQIGITGVYTDAAAVMTVDSNSIHDVGRTNNAANSFDHGVYFHGNLKISNNLFYSSRSGWHIQTAYGAIGSINNNKFSGPNMFDSKYGQIELWDRDGAIVIANNLSVNSRGTFIDQYQFSSPMCAVYNNLVQGGASLGAPSGCALSGPMPYGPIGPAVPTVPTVPLSDGARITNLEQKICGYTGTGCASQIKKIKKL